MPHINPEKMIDILEGLLNLVAHCESLSRNHDLSDGLGEIAHRIQDIINTISSIDDRVSGD